MALLNFHTETRSVASVNCGAFYIFQSFIRFMWHLLDIWPETNSVACFSSETSVAKMQFYCQEFLQNCLVIINIKNLLVPKPPDGSTEVIRPWFKITFYDQHKTFSQKHIFLNQILLNANITTCLTTWRKSWPPVGNVGITAYFERYFNV